MLSLHIVSFPFTPTTAHSWVSNGRVQSTSMLFSLRSVSKTFTVIADALEWVLCNRGVRFLWYYIDDFISCSPPASMDCAHALGTTLSACHELGMPISAHTVDGPAMDITVLGIRMNTVTLTLSLPDDKLHCLQHLLVVWGDKGNCTRCNLQSLMGLLNHACKVVRLGRLFLRRMLHHTEATTAPRPHHLIRLNASFRADLQWWRTFVAEWNGVYILPDH